MASYELVKGLPVITMAEGKQIGKIDDLIIDPERKAVSWLRLHAAGWGCSVASGCGCRPRRCMAWGKMP